MARTRVLLCSSMPASYFMYLLIDDVHSTQIGAITRLTFMQNKYEGNFRYLHTQIRTFCESIAFVTTHIYLVLFCFMLLMMPIDVPL
jgi:ABC-type uncharacterized transport system fused permease/ATPase subunit